MSMQLNYRASNSAMYYTPERRIYLIRATLAFVVAALGAIAGGFVYARLQPNLTSPYLRVGEVAAGAVAVGLLGMIPVHYGKVRLPVVAAFMGTAIALIAVYAMWVTWVHHAFRFGAGPLGYWALARRPIVVFRLVQFINAVGTWKWDGTRVNGIPLLIFWLGEFSAMLVAGVFMPLKAIGTDDPVCRGCGSVCKLVRPIARFAVDRKAELIAAVEAYDFAALLAHSPPRDDVEPQLSLRLLACPQCGQTNVATVNYIGWSTDSQGNRKLKITPVVNQLLVPQAEAAELKGILKQLAERPEAPVAQVAAPPEPSPGLANVEESAAGDQSTEADA